MQFSPALPQEINGFLFIGDLHLASVKPSRRQDDYTAAGLDKLRQCVAIANERNLQPVCLGDLFHRPRDNDLVLLSRLSNILRQFKHTMLLVAGSHDRTETMFTERDADSLLAQMGVLKLIENPGKVLSLAIGSETVNLWATPAGCKVPKSVAAEAGSHNIMVTHHDFDFNGPYPGCVELTEIQNCGMLVNGHMHTQTPMIFRGLTACHNPGSVMRNAINLKNQKPVVSVWTPAHGVSLEAVPLVVAQNVFNLIGNEVFAAEPKELKEALPKGLRLSSFAAKWREAHVLEAARTDDGALLIEEFGNYFEKYEKPDNLKRYLSGLLAEVVNKRMGSEVLEPATAL